MGTRRSSAPTQIPSTPAWRKSGQDQDINAPTDSKDKYSFDFALPEWGSDRVTQISISLSNKFIILKNVALKITMGLKVDLLNMLSTGRN